MTLATALAWADSHGLLLPAILGAITVAARVVWGLLRPVVLRRAPGAVPIVEGAALRVAALLPDVLGALLRRPARVIVVDSSRPAAPPSGRSGESGSAVVGALVIAAALGLAGLALQGCPRLPPVSGCDPGTHRCADDRPEVCSATRRWHPVGDLTCAAVGGVCVNGLSAHCAPVDGGVR